MKILSHVVFKNKQYPILEWEGDFLGDLLAIDTETTPIQPGIFSTLLTCQVFNGEKVYFIPLEKIFTFFGLHQESTLIFHTFSFDFWVLYPYAKLWAFIETNRIYDISILYRLYMLAKEGNIPKEYSLRFLSKEFLSFDLIKDSEIRLSFSVYSDIRTKAAYLEYAALDVITTFFIFKDLKKYVDVFDTHKTSLSQSIQIKGSVALAKIENTGVFIDENKKNLLISQFDTILNKNAALLKSYGWEKGIKGNTKVFEDTIKSLNIVLPTTPAGRMTSKEEILREYSHIEFIDAFLTFKKYEKLKSFISKLESGKTYPSYNLLVNTGRTSCRKPNFQQLPRNGGIREIFIPKDGYLFVIADYSTIELCTLSQITYKALNFSNMREMINADIDIHNYYAHRLLNKPMEEVTRDERQLAKAANFGFPGGLGCAAFMDYIKNGYGIILTQKEVFHMREVWFNTFPEVRQYLSSTSEDVFTLTGRLRGQCTYCQSKNTPFQGLAADGAKISLYNLVKKGIEVVAFIHDEVVCQIPYTNEEMHKKYIDNINTIMVSSMKEVCPDVNIKVNLVLHSEFCK